MEIILLQRVENLGGLGDCVKVKPGYARNYLIPTGRAKAATPENIAAFEERRAELERQEYELLSGAEARAAALEGKSFTVRAKAGNEGKLFGSVSATDIAEAITSIGIKVEKREVRLPEGPLRLAGEYEITIHLHTDVDVQVNLVIEPDSD